MYNRILKIILVLVLVVGVQLFATGSGLAANEENDTSKLEQQLWWKKNKQRENPETPEDLPRLGNGPENPERNQEPPITHSILKQNFPETVFLQGPTTEKKIAITFDDGPDPRYSEQVLDVLAEYNVPATFFVMGARAVAYPEIVERMIADGHIVGNHTYFHPNLVKEASLATLEREVKRTEDALKDIIGYRTKLFRPPYGFLYNELVEKVAELNYSIILWTVDSLDWQEDPPEIIADNVVNNVQPGSIILMHDGGDWDDDRTNTIKSLRQILPTLKEQGYEFVTVPELLNIPYQK